MNAAIRALVAGATIWKEDAKNQTLKQYIVCNDAAWKMNDKFDFLRQLLTQFNGLRSEEEVDGAYEKEIEDCVTGKEPEVTRATAEWEEISANFVEKMNNPPDKTPATVEAAVTDETESNTEGKESSKDQTSYRPREVLTIQDGITYLQSWKKTMETYFKVSGHQKRPLDIQRALFVTNLDAELTKNFEQDIDEKGEDTNLANMLATVQHIFDELHPINQRRARLFEHRQGQRTDWTSWSATWYDAWKEASSRWRSSCASWPYISPTTPS